MYFGICVDLKKNGIKELVYYDSGKHTTNTQFANDGTEKPYFRNTSKCI